MQEGAEASEQGGHGGEPQVRLVQGLHSEREDGEHRDFHVR